MTNNTLKTAFYHTRVAIESEEDEPTSRPFKPTSHYSPEPEVVYLTWLEQEVHSKPVTLRVQIRWPNFEILTMR